MLKKNLFIIILLVISCLRLSGQNKDVENQWDSIYKLRKLSLKKDLGVETQIFYAKKGVDLSYKTGVDSTILKSKRILAYTYSFDSRFYPNSRTLSHSILKESIKTNNIFAAAIICDNLAYTYRFSRYKDSSYYYYDKALRLLEKTENDDSLSRKPNHLSYILINKAYLENDVRDYYGSQLSAIKGINLICDFEDQESLNTLVYLYNILGLNLHSVKDYKKSLEYYNKALVVSKKITNNYEDVLFIKINIAELYKDTEAYNQTFSIYNELLRDTTLYKKYPSSYGAILNNLAHTKFLAKSGSLKTIDSLFKKAYNIFEDLNLDYELSASGNDMAEFYYANHKKEEALYYSDKALNRGRKIKEFEEVLRSLKMISKLNKGEAGKQYLYHYIKIKDSLIDRERLNRNKYARIRYETDQYIQETERLGTVNLLIIVIASILILVLGLMYFIKQQHAKNKELLFVSEQEQANQEIYKLMLKQQTKQEEGRLQERHRIAEDLHDGILSRLFGTRMGMGFLDIKGDKNTLEEYQSFMHELQQIEKEVRDVSHELKTDTIYLDTNYKSIINQYVKTQSVIGGFKYKVDYLDNLNFNELNEIILVEVYRVIQEALQNVVKHSKAIYVNISFILRGNTLRVIIKDDGKGFKPKESSKGIGLKNIESRLIRIRGDFKITSLTNKGTTLRIDIPL